MEFPDRVGLYLRDVEISADGRSCALNYTRWQSDLFLVEGLK